MYTTYRRQHEEQKAGSLPTVEEKCPYIDTCTDSYGVNPITSTLLVAGVQLGPLLDPAWLPEVQTVVGVGIDQIRFHILRPGDPLLSDDYNFVGTRANAE